MSVMRPPGSFGHRGRPVLDQHEPGRGVLVQRLVVLKYETATFWAIHKPWPRLRRGPTGNEGAVRVGRADGSEPHLRLGQGGSVQAVALPPDGQGVASASGSEIRLWPMPD